MILLAALVAAAVAQGDVERAAELYAAGRCAEAEPLLEPEEQSSARAAYFLGACRLARSDFDGAERAFDTAARDPGWEALALFMRGVARLRAGRAEAGRQDLAQARDHAELPPDLRDVARELLAAGAPAALHAAFLAGAEGDSNVMQAPEVALPGAESIASPVGTALGVVLWDAGAGVQMRATVLRREVFRAPEASVGGALLTALWRSDGAPWRATAALEATGFLLRWSPFLAAGAARASVDWAPAGSPWRAAATVRARLDRLAVPYAGQSGLELGGGLEVGASLGALQLRAGLDELSDWTDSQDFAREAGVGSLEATWTLAALVLRARAEAGLHFYRHQNSLRDRQGERTARRDQRYEAVLGAEIPLAVHWAITAEVGYTRNLSSIEAYQFGRGVARSGVSYAF